MFRRKLVTLTAALVALFAIVAVANAQFGPGQQGPLANPYRSSGPVFVAPAAPVVQPAATSQSFFNNPDQNNRSVLIQMNVPENAQVWFGDQATRQTGASRQYVSPPLTSGQLYVYDVRVRWNRDGQPAERTQRVTVRAGDRINLDFSSPESR
jgi:uncharacterized protein (TIGR03000 family)